MSKFFKRQNKLKTGPEKTRHVLAQSATELAIFGAILMFVIGLIVRAGLYQGHSLNVQLRTMRMALTESYKTAHGHYRYKANEGQPAGARNTASVLLVEDRISVDSAQALGTRDRIPIMSSASGSMSHNLFWSLDYGNNDDLPIFDVYVNGQRFPLSTGRFMEATVTPFWNQAARINLNYYQGGPKQCDPGEERCYSSVRVPPCGTDRFPGGPFCALPGCVSYGRGNPDLCIIAYKKIYNVPPPAGDEWCDVPGHIACPAFDNADDRFDLDRDGNPDVPAGELIPASGPDGGAEIYLRQVFNWQWARLALTQPRSKLGSRLHIPKTADGIDMDNSVNRYFDIDGDLEEEYVLEVDFNRGRVQRIRYVDYQEGDIDFTKENVGLKDDVQIYSRANAPVLEGASLLGGTYMLVEEGKLWDSDGQFIRDITRQDQIDIISRKFQLSRNTGRFCTDDGLLVFWNQEDSADTQHPVRGVKHLANPVEACGETAGGFSTCETVHTDKTCLDVDTHVLYIRSRIDDLRGNRWITRTFQ